MLHTLRVKVIKRCPHGHRMELHWLSCPRCTGQTGGSEAARDMTEMTVVASPEQHRVLAQAPPSSGSDGAPKPIVRLEVLEGPLAGQRFDLWPGKVKLGKQPATEPDVRALVLGDPYTSREHAAITAGVGGIILVDLGSTNGTFVNDRRVERAMLAAGDRVRMGRTVMLISPA